MAKKSSKSVVMHPNNPHQGRYNFDLLCQHFEPLQEFLISNRNGEPSIDFSDEQSVIYLNKALLKQFYDIDYWDLPEGYRSPVLPARADYLHYASQLLADMSYNKEHNPAPKPPTGKKINVLDIGVGANCILPIIGNRTFDWHFLASETDPVAFKAAEATVLANGDLKNKVQLFHQPEPTKLLKGLLDEFEYRNEFFDLLMCNPPQYQSFQDLKDHIQARNPDAVIDEQVRPENWCSGGETSFIKRLIMESETFSHQVCWFTCLVHDDSLLKPLKKMLNQVGAKQISVRKTKQSAKGGQFIAWSFYDREGQKDWADERW